MSSREWFAIAGALLVALGMYGAATSRRRRADVGDSVAVHDYSARILKVRRNAVGELVADLSDGSSVLLTRWDGDRRAWRCLELAGSKPQRTDLEPRIAG